MPDYSFDRLSSGLVKMIVDTEISYLPGNSIPDPRNDGSIVITNSLGKNYIIPAGANITIAGTLQAPAGTARAKAEANSEVLATQTFFSASGDFLETVKRRFGGGRIYVVSHGNGTTNGNLGGGFASTGTATTRNVDNASFFTNRKRVGYVGAAAINTSVGWRANITQYLLHNVFPKGGVFVQQKFGNSGASNAALRALSGFLAATGVFTASSDPSSLTNIFGFACDAGDANWQWINNDNSGVAVKTDLGADFPKNTQNLDIYETAIWFFPGEYAVYWYIRNQTTGKSKTGKVTTELPAVNLLVAWQTTFSSGANATAPEIDMLEVDIRLPF